MCIRANHEPGWNIKKAGLHRNNLRDFSQYVYLLLYLLPYISFLLSHFWWNCPRIARLILSCNTLIFTVCKSDPACCYLHWSCLFVVNRRSHRLRASVWGTAGGDHLPWGVARGKNHHELPCPGQSTCHIQVTYVPHKPSIITIRCAFSVSPIVWYFSYCIVGSACLNLDAPPRFVICVYPPSSAWLCDIYFQAIFHQVLLSNKLHYLFCFLQMFFLMLTTIWMPSLEKPNNQDVDTAATAVQQMCLHLILQLKI